MIRDLICTMGVFEGKIPFISIDTNDGIESTMKYWSVIIEGPLESEWEKNVAVWTPRRRFSVSKGIGCDRKIAATHRVDRWTGQKLCMHLVKSQSYQAKILGHPVRLTMKKHENGATFLAELIIGAYQLSKKRFEHGHTKSKRFVSIACQVPSRWSRNI